MRNSIFFILIFIISACKEKSQVWVYPKYESKPVSEKFFGSEVVDEFRSLEQIDSPNVKRWFDEQRKFYQSVIGRISGKDSLISEMRKLAASSNVRSSIPRLTEEGVFFKRRLLKENITELVYRDSLKKEVKVLDTNDLHKLYKKDVTIDFYEPSFDGKFIAIGISSGGTEMSTIHILDVKGGKFLEDSIPRCMYGNPNWTHDGSGFFYNQLKEQKGQSDLAVYENSSVKFHHVGSDSKNDAVVFSREALPQLDLQPIDFPFLLTLPQSETILVIVYRGTNIYYLTFSANLNEVLADPSQAKWTIQTSQDDKVTAHAQFKDELFVLSFKNNPNGEILRKNVNNSATLSVLSDSSQVLQEIIQTKQKFYVKYLKNGYNGLVEIDGDDYSITNVNLPFKGSVTLSSDGRGYTHSDDLYVGIDSWTNPYGIYKYENGVVSLTDIWPQQDYNNDIELISKEVLVTSHDGESVPLSIVYCKDISLNGDNPTILTGYGAYGFSLTPLYSVNRLAWFKRGGIYAVAHVRGGGEKGDAWYKGGFKTTKSNSWKDFIACADFLVKEGYTSTEKLASEGESAGAITVGRAMIDRPDLFKAVVLRVGELNSLRSEYSKNTLSVPEFGTVKDSIGFKYLFQMDVYNNIKPREQYPAAFFTTAMNDSRVDPWQPAKTVAKMQSVSNGSNLVLLRISGDGHFGDNDFVRELGESYAFLLSQFGYPDFAIK